MDPGQLRASPEEIAEKLSYHNRSRWRGDEGMDLGQLTESPEEASENIYPEGNCWDSNPNFLPALINPEARRPKGHGTVSGWAIQLVETTWFPQPPFGFR